MRSARGAAQRKKKGTGMATDGNVVVLVCLERLGDIASLLDQIGQELNERFRPLEEAGVDEGDAETLRRTREQLIGALQDVSPFSRQEIEETLAEVRS